MTAEQWKPVVGFEDCYEVSDLGRVRSRDRYVVLEGHPTLAGRNMPGRLLHLKPNGPAGSPYTRLLVSLWKDNKETTRNVARLVAQAFIPNPTGLPCVLHLDDDATNNIVSNLQWGDHAENSRQAVERGRTHCGEQHHGHVLTDQQRRDAYEMLRAGEGVKEVARRFGVRYQVISNLKTGKQRGFPALEPTRRRLTAEEQAHAWRLMSEGASAASVAQSLGVGINAISKVRSGKVPGLPALPCRNRPKEARV